MSDRAKAPNASGAAAAVCQTRVTSYLWVFVDTLRVAVTENLSFTAVLQYKVVGVLSLLYWLSMYIWPDEWHLRNTGPRMLRLVTTNAGVTLRLVKAAAKPLCGWFVRVVHRKVWACQQIGRHMYTVLI